ncbi:fimbrial protein [Providencia rettgeri]
MGRTITGYDYDAASLGVGRINIMSNYLQPVGSTLAIGISNYSTILRGGLGNLSDEDIILTCTAQNDKTGLAWAFATNGDSRIGGFYEIPGNPGYFATQFPYVGIKLTIADTGETFSRFWQKSAATVQTEDTPNGGFVIRKKHIPKVMASLVKWSKAYGETTDANGNRVSASYCSGGSETLIPTSQTANINQVWSANYFGINGMAAGCGQPNGYINLLGTGGITANIGTDTNTSAGIYSWQYSIPVGLNGNPSALFSYTPSCVVRTTTPYVSFPTVSVSQLSAGQTVSSNFGVTLECDNMMSKTVSTSAISIGLQPSLKAYNNAVTLGLINGASGGVTYLVSDDYTGENMAKGVGITLKNADGNSVNFVSWAGCIPRVSSNNSDCPPFTTLSDMRSAGWDPIMSASTQISEDTVNATTSYRKNYVAILSRIDTMTPTAGKIKATATVLVRFP